MSAVAPIALRREAAPATFPAAAPLYLVLLSLPVWWVLGLAYFIWPLLTLPLLFSLLARGEIRRPPFFGVWVLFLAWMMLSGVELHGRGGMLAFAWRGVMYLSATSLFLYVFNAPRERYSNRTIVMVMALFWVEIVAAGLVGVLLPNGSFTTPFASVLPASLANDENIRFMIYPKFAEVQTFLGYPVGRPRVLFPYSNQWGACIGILTPLAVAAVLQMRKSLKRRLFIGLLLLSLVPIVVSLNRGLWLALVAAVAYLGIRFVRLRNLKVLGAALAALAVAAAIVVATPLNGVLQDRLTTHSNSTNTRLSVYGKTTEQVKKSPLLGYGSPKASHDPNAPPAGTQGQLFLVGYSHGIPGLIFFVGWFLIGLLYSRRFNTREQPWAHVAFLILLLEIPYYSLMPTTLHAMMVIAALAWRNVVDPPPVPEAS